MVLWSKGITKIKKLGDKSMKKFLSLAVALVATAMLTSSVFAGTTTLKSVTATAAFAGSATFSFNLFKVSDDSAATTIDWTSADAFVMGSTTTWVQADQYAVVAATVTKAGYSVYMNTNNKADKPNLEPNYTEWNEGQGVPGTETYGGLVRAGSTGGAFRGYIPVVFSYSATKNKNITPFDAQGKEIVTNAQSDRFLADVSNGGYDQNYTTIASLNGPTFFTKNEEGDNVQFPSEDVVNNTAYMYFFGGFKDIIGGDSYTTKIDVIEVVE